jgi:hypothetical protein
MKRKLINRGGMVMTEGRINIHLREYKQPLTELHPGYGELSKIIRALIQGYLEGRIMHLSPKISELLDAGKDEEAIELLTSDLVALRQRRVQAGQRATKKRSGAKSQKAKDKAGIKTPEQQQADKMVEDMLKLAEADQTTIEFAGEDKDDGSEEEEGTTGVSGVASRASRRDKT